MRDTWNMTPDEARKYILQNWFDGDENVNAFVCGDEEYTAMAIAVEALEATKWHYPSKGEYPPKNKHLKEDANVLCLFNNGSRDVAWYIKTKDREGWLTSCGLEPAKSVKCWQYIVPPKEEV